MIASLSGVLDVTEIEKIFVLKNDKPNPKVLRWAKVPLKSVRLRINLDHYGLDSESLTHTLYCNLFFKYPHSNQWDYFQSKVLFKIKKDHIIGPILKCHLHYV